MAFKDTLKRLMDEQNIKAADLARMADISEAIVSMYLSGKKEPMGKTSITIARALNVSLDELWDTEYANSVQRAMPLSGLLSPESLEIAALYDKASDHQKNIVKVTLEYDLKKETVSAKNSDSSDKKTAG